MSKQSKRRKRSKMIRAMESKPLIQFDANSVDWIKAADGGGDDADKPKRFSMTAYTGGAMEIGYYDASVVIELAGMTAAAPVPILMNHDMGKIVGHADEIETTASTLKLAGVVSGASPEADQVTASAGLGFPWKASVGLRPDKLEFIGEGVTTKANGKTFKGPVYVARKSTLGEVSFVAMAADGKTSAKVAAIAAYTRKDTDMKFDEWVKDGMKGYIAPFVYIPKDNYYKTADLFDIEKNIFIGKWYLRRLKNHYLKDDYTIERMLHAWNGGITRLRKLDYDCSKMPRESREFSKKVLRLYEAKK